jgi:hypothetical protein
MASTPDSAPDIHEVSLQTEAEAYDFAFEHGIDISRDLDGHPGRTARLKAGEHMTETGADYTFYEIEYLEDDEVKASRMIAAIPPGGRTELAYWTSKGGDKTLTVHQGSGGLVHAHPWERASIGLLDARASQNVVLSAESFYTLKAADAGLVISGYYEPPWTDDDIEATFEPDAVTVETIDGELHVPSFYRALQPPKSEKPADSVRA